MLTGGSAAVEVTVARTTGRLLRETTVERHTTGRRTTLVIRTGLGCAPADVLRHATGQLEPCELDAVTRALGLGGDGETPVRTP